MSGAATAAWVRSVRQHGQFYWSYGLMYSKLDLDTFFRGTKGGSKPRACALITLVVGGAALLALMISVSVYELTRKPDMLPVRPHSDTVRACTAWSADVARDVLGYDSCHNFRPVLQFTANGTFKIVQFTDLHFGESWRKDEATQKAMISILEAETDVGLVVLSGDMVSGNFWDRRADRWYETRWRDVAAPMEAAGVAFASIAGNHDGQGGLRHPEIARLDAESSHHSLTRPPPPAAPAPRSLGGGPLGLALGEPRDRQLPPAAEHVNYHLDICGSQGGGAGGGAGGGGACGHDGRGAVAARLWMLDSGDHGCTQSAEGYGCVPEATLHWLKLRTAEWMHRPPHVPLLPPVPTSAAFVHIPPQEFMEAWYDSGAEVNGSRHEEVCCAATWTPLVPTLRQAGISSVQVGHDHNNDFVARLAPVMQAPKQSPTQGSEAAEGRELPMRLAYGRKTGHGGYGPSPFFERGARVVVLREGQDAAFAETYIRTESKKKVRQKSADAARKQAHYGGKQKKCHH